MKVKELAEKCKERNIECDDCPYLEECENFSDMLDDISPCGILTILDDEIE